MGKARQNPVYVARTANNLLILLFYLVQDAIQFIQAVVTDHELALAPPITLNPYRGPQFLGEALLQTAHIRICFTGHRPGWRGS